MTKSSRSPPPAAAGKGSGKNKMAAKKWVGWEEEVVLDENGRRVVCYYLRCTPPRDGDGEVERDLAVVGKFWGVGNMVYSAHAQFLRSMEAAAAQSQAPSRAVAVALEATQLRWKSRREVMDWLTSLVADSPYRTSASADRPDGCSLVDHDGGTLAPKDTPSTFAGNNREGFAWLGPLPHLDTRKKHYRSFCLDGMRISVYDFICIKNEEGRESNVGYVEDMYEDGSGNNMALARWLDKPDDDHGVTMPPDVHDREVFFSYGLQDVGVQFVEGLARVLNYQDFERFQRREEEHSKWKPYLCYRQIVGKTLEPFDIAQLQGYANQEVVRALSRAPSTMVVCAKAPNKDETDGGQKRKHDEIIDQIVENPDPANVANGRTLIVIDDDSPQKLPPCNATNDQTVPKDALQNVISNNTVQKLLSCSATSDQTVQELPPRDSSGDQIVANCAPQNVISEQTGENNGPVNAPKTETVVNKPLRNAADAQAVVLHPSGGSASGSRLLGSVIKENKDELFDVGCRIEALSHDSSLRGCWFRCVIVKRKWKTGLIKVKHQDVPNVEGKGHLKEWIRLSRAAEPDGLGIRLTGRPTIRPWPSNLAKITYPVTAGTIVDARLHNGWWEGIVIQPRTAGHVRVYFPGERKTAEFVEGELRRSYEWVGDKWLALMARTDLVSRLPPPDVLANQVWPIPEVPKAVSQLSSMGGARHAKPAGPKMILQQIKGNQSAKPVPPMAILQSMQVDVNSSKPAAQNTSSQQPSQKAEGASTELVMTRPRLQSREKFEDEQPAPEKTILHFSPEELRLQSSKKGPGVAVEKVSLQYCEEGDGMSFTDGVPPDVKRPRVDLTDFLVLKWAERKARGSGPMMGYSDGSSQEGITDSAPVGDTAPVNSVPVEEECKVNEQASVSTTPPIIDLTDAE
ncbi:unnamed protein product [Alopecurus aequalis]